MGLHAIVVDKRVVDIEQEDNIGRTGHRIHPILEPIGALRENWRAPG
jgi:hypothetical protein